MSIKAAEDMLDQIEAELERRRKLAGESAKSKLPTIDTTGNHPLVLDDW